MNPRERQKVVEVEANRVRRALGAPRGVMIMIDWGDGIVGSWLAAEPNSVLKPFVENMEAEARRMRKLGP